MAFFKPFCGIRPLKEHVARIASRPYDVLDSEEARVESAGNEFSFLHVVKPEIDLPREIDPHDPKVYAKGKENFEMMEKQGWLIRDPFPCYYIYQLEMDGRKQTGLVGCAGIDDYRNGIIKKHELTRADKEEDRRTHVRVSRLHAEPVFFTYRRVEEISRRIGALLKSKPVYDFVTEDGIAHRFWVIEETKDIKQLESYFSKVPAFYVADGHHRTAAAAAVAGELGQVEAGFLAVVFPDSELAIMDYNRVVKDLNGNNPAQFLNKLKGCFEVEPLPAADRPGTAGVFSLYLAKKWYRLRAKSEQIVEDDPVASLDVSLLSRTVLEPLLGIVDLRRDKRIDFVGGIRGLGELQRRVDSGEMAAAFALHPVSLEQLLRIADAGEIMPPKTTWFEPKLRSGLVVNRF